MQSPVVPLDRPARPAPCRARLLAMGALLMGGVFLSFLIGRYPVAPLDLMRMLAARALPVQTTWQETAELVVFSIRLPRVLLSCMVGCCLAAAGASYQGVFQNPMASPDVLGASSGAALGAALAILFRAGPAAVTASAFAFSLMCVGLVILVSNRARGKKVLGLILSGIMISSLFSSGTSFVKLAADPGDQLPAITFWLMGSLSGAKMSDVLFALAPMAMGCAALLALKWRVNVLTLGDEEARTMGVHAGRLRLWVILASTLVTAASVAVSGMIGWVGLVIPHVARRVVGSNYRYLMPASMMLGALFLLMVDTLCRSLLATEIPLGILTSLAGAPFFIYLMTRESERF